MIKINVEFFVFLFVKDIGTVIIRDDRKTDLKVSFFEVYVRAKTSYR